MGSRSAETLKVLAERERVLARLRATLSELEERAPSMPSMPGGLPKIASGSGGAGVALWVMRKAIKRARGKKKKAQKREKHSRRAQIAPSVTVKVLPSGTALAIIGAAAIWAGIKYLEIQRRGDGGLGAALRSVPSRKGA